MTNRKMERHFKRKERERAAAFRRLAKQTRKART